MLLPLLLLRRRRRRAQLQASVTCGCKQALLHAGAQCCCCKRAHHQRKGCDLRSYDALFITVEPCLGRCCGAETALLAWWLWRYEDHRMPSWSGRREFLEQELCLIFSFQLLFCLVADEEDNEKMRVLIPAGAEQRTRWTVSCLLVLSAACCFCSLLLLLLLQVGSAAARLWFSCK